MLVLLQRISSTAKYPVSSVFVLEKFLGAIDLVMCSIYRQSIFENQYFGRSQNRLGRFLLLQAVDPTMSDPRRRGLILSTLSCDFKKGDITAVPCRSPSTGDTQE